MEADNNVKLIIGVGNEFRGDDAAGLIAARRIKELNAYGFEVIENSGDGAGLIEKWSRRELVILIDAVVSGAPPGTVHKFAPHNIMQLGMFTFSTHLFSIPQAIELSLSLGKMPREMVIYGIEADSFESGRPISPEVEKAIDEIVEDVTQHMLLNA